MTIFEDLIPEPLPAGVKVLYGTVTGSSPLRVQVDRDPGPLPVTPTTTVACAVGDRVVMLSHVRADNPDARARAVVIVGVIGGETIDVSSSFSSIVPSGQGVSSLTWSAHRTGRLVTVFMALAHGWAGGTWVGLPLLSINNSALYPAREVNVPFPWSPYCVIQASTSDNRIGLSNASGTPMAGVVHCAISYVTN